MRSQAIAKDLEAVVKAVATQMPTQALSSLPPNHDIRHLLRQILLLASESVDRSRTPLVMSQKIVQSLYKTPTQLGREVFVALLDELCHSYEDVAKEAITWLLYAEDEASTGARGMIREINASCSGNMTSLLQLPF